MAQRLRNLASSHTLLIMVWLLLPWAPSSFAATAVTLVLSDSTAIYQEVAQALIKALEKDSRDWQVRIQPLEERPGPGREDLVIPLGLKALQRVLAEPANTPVWSLLVPRQTFERLADQQPDGRQRALSALYLDQPPARHIQMLQAALPHAKRLGLLLGPTSSAQAEAFRLAASKAELEIFVERVRQGGELIPTLDKFRDQADVLLLLPDPLVVGRGTLQTLLLHTYQMRLPVAAYSIQLVEAGAMLALYAAPSQIGQEAGMRLRHAQAGNGLRLPAPDYPASHDVAVNRSVAVSLGIPVPVREVVRMRMTREETP